MSSLVWLLIPIALIDSLSVIPLCLVPLAIIMAGKRPFLCAICLILGIFAIYFPLGVLIALGIDAISDHFGELLQRMWSHPTTTELIIQIIIGFVLIALAYSSVGHRGEKKAAKQVTSISPLQAFAFGAVFTLLGFWGALPYFAAIEQILRKDPSHYEAIILLLWYNVIFVFPLLLLVVIGFFFHDQCRTIFAYVKVLFDRLGRRVTIALFMILGIVLVADGIGWFFGHPLLPV